jgi:hypothetical protein
MRREALRRPLGAAVVALLLAAAGFVLGLSWWNSLALGLAAVAAYGLRRPPDVNTDEDWPDRGERADKGARREVARLSWSLQGFESRVERASVRRLRRIATGRLAERGLTLTAPADAAACRQLLGDRSYALLSTDEGDRPFYDDFREAVGAVERLHPAEAEGRR